MGLNISYLINKLLGVQIKGTDVTLPAQIKGSDVNLPVQLTGSIVENDRVKVDVNGATVNATLGDQKSATVDVTLQDLAVAAGDGTPFTLGAFKTLTLEITGTSTSRTVIFEGASITGAWYTIQGVKLQDLSMATQTTGNNEVWQLDVTGLVSFRARISAVAGGNVTVKGKAVA